jgi:alkanesulfonate monooxygenase SsuD/methylene tetrahydromethanopterin reductase-like flavin-dependent oxidoreductase (luciferase family)
VQFGTFVDLQLPRPWHPDSEQTLLREALEQVEIADRIGIDVVWTQEHHFLEEYSHSSAPEVFLGACSQRTHRIRLGHGITLMPPGFNATARIVERIATLDLLSGGRVEWGTGESSSRIELEGFGIPYVEKRAMWAEAVREAVRMACMTPYPGYQGRYLSMPPRNVVPKPAQRPHPPLWVACSNRDTLRLAARLGMGALTFAFMDKTEARFWVEEYYDTFRRECVPIGQAVNPNVAMLVGSMCHRDAATARDRGLQGLQFFAYGLSHYYRTGTHRPGRTDLWAEFLNAADVPMAGTTGIGCPEEIRETFRHFEAAGVDQLILLQQCGTYRHEHICQSLELLGSEVLPEFRAREVERVARKTEELAPFVARALERVTPLEDVDPPEVASYPVLWAKNGADGAAPSRSLGAAAMWKLHVGGGGGKR